MELTQEEKFELNLRQNEIVSFHSFVQKVFFFIVIQL